MASIGAVATPSQGASYYERDGDYAKDDSEHRAASAWAGLAGEQADTAQLDEVLESGFGLAPGVRFEQLVGVGGGLEA